MQTLDENDVTFDDEVKMMELKGVDNSKLILIIKIRIKNDSNCFTQKTKTVKYAAMIMTPIRQINTINCFKLKM